MSSNNSQYNGQPRCPACSGTGHLFRVFGEHRLFRCSVCGSLFYRPQITSGGGSLGDVWESEKWYVERGANLLFYAEVIHNVTEALRLASLTRPDKQIHFLEIGGSYGFLTDMARMIPQWTVSGVDPAEVAQRGSEALGFKLFGDRVEDLNSDRAYDVVVAVQVIEHVQDPESFARAVSRLVREDGLVVVTTPDGTREDLGVDYWPGEHFVLFSPAGLETLFSRNGIPHWVIGRTGLNQLFLTVGSKRKLSFDLHAVVNSRQEASMTLLLDYLRLRLQSDGMPPLLEAGLTFRLFEILVNLGRYAEAEKAVQRLEHLAGVPSGHGCETEFMTELARSMTATRTAEEYMLAGPCWCAPYLLYKGIVKLNHQRDYEGSVQFLGSAVTMFEHETKALGMIQYEPLREAAHDTLAIAHTRAFGGITRRQRVKHHFNGPPCEAEFLTDGSDAFGADLAHARVSQIRVRGGESFQFPYECRVDNLCGLAFGLVVRPVKRGAPTDLELHITCREDPDLSRIAGFRVEPVGIQRPTLKAYSVAEVFQFEPIADSRGVVFQLTLKVPETIRYAHIISYVNDSEASGGGQSRDRKTQPVIVSYRARNTDEPRKGFSGDPPLVSVLVVTFNSEQFIRKCLDSVRNQEYPNIEVIVLDNGSSDGTVEIVRQEYPEARMFEVGKNLHFSKGNNVAFSICSGDYICVLNSDAQLETHAIAILMKGLESSPHVGIAGGVIDTRGSIVRYADAFLKEGRIRPGFVNQLTSGQRFCAAPCGALFMMKRKVVVEVGELFDELFSADWEDHDLGLRCWLKGYSCLHIGRLAARHEGAGAFGRRNRRRSGRVIRNSLVTYYKNYEFASFLKAAARTAFECRSPWSLWGIVLFLSSFRKFTSARKAIQKERRLNDAVLRVLAAGLPARIHNEETPSKRY